MNDCKVCPIAIINIFGDIGCPMLKDWLTHTEYKEKKVLDNCPKKEQKIKDFKELQTKAKELCKSKDVRIDFLSNGFEIYGDTFYNDGKIRFCDGEWDDLSLEEMLKYVKVLLEEQK